METTVENKTSLDDQKFRDDVERYGVSYALLQKEIEAKKTRTGKNLSASEYARAERMIRKLTTKVKDANDVSSLALVDLCNELNACEKLYFNFPPNPTWDIEPFLLPAEKNAKEWVKYGSKPQEASTPNPIPERRHKYRFSFRR